MTIDDLIAQVKLLARPCVTLSETGSGVVAGY